MNSVTSAAGSVRSLSKVLTIRLPSRVGSLQGEWIVPIEAKLPVDGPQRSPIQKVESASDIDRYAAPLFDPRAVDLRPDAGTYQTKASAHFRGQIARDISKEIRSIERRGPVTFGPSNRDVADTKAGILLPDLPYDAVMIRQQ